MQQRDVIIIGGGPAGRVIVHALHTQNSGLSVTLIKDEEINVNRCAVPYGIPPDKPIEKFQIPNQLVTPIRTKLVFERDTRRLIGGSVMRKGHGAAQNVDFISFAIQMQTTLEDLLSYQYATHPELAAKPSDNTYVFAARDAHGKL